MDWDDAVEYVKTHWGLYGYVEDWDKVAAEARNVLIKDCRKKHREYLKSDKWLKLREKILRRDNGLCQDCLRISPEIKDMFNKVTTEPIRFQKKAEEIHHTSYDNLRLEREFDDCVSLCENCHKLRHCKSDYGKGWLKEKRRELLLLGVHREILRQPEMIRMAKEQHDSFMKTITIKPDTWLKK